jgi:hypothetical protein
MDYRRMGEDEAVDFILRTLRGASGPLTTRQILEEAGKSQLRCPDSTVVFLNRLRIRGLIRGERSRERRGWIWWVDDEASVG